MPDRHRNQGCHQKRVEKRGKAGGGAGAGAWRRVQARGVEECGHAEETACDGDVRRRALRVALRGPCGSGTTQGFGLYPRLQVLTLKRQHVTAMYGAELSGNGALRRPCERDTVQGFG